MSNESELIDRDDELGSALFENRRLRNEVIDLKILVTRLDQDIDELKERSRAKAWILCFLTAVVVWGWGCNHTNEVREAARDALYERIGKVLTDGDVDMVSRRMEI